MKQFIVDAFCNKLFCGNPAAICVLDTWLEDELMINIAKENNLSETAFVVKNNEKYDLRWFTPKSEIEICGHATLASAFVLFNYFEKTSNKINFNTKSGILTANKKENIYEVDMPKFELKRIGITNNITDAIGIKPIEVYLGSDLVCVMKDENDVISVKPNIKKVKNLEGSLLHITAKSNKYDCVTRSFAPKHNVEEDPVCGRGHCHVVPLWSKKLGKNKLIAYQASERSGILYCETLKDRVKLGGSAILFSIDEIAI